MRPERSAGGFEPPPAATIVDARMQTRLLWRRSATAIGLYGGVVLGFAGIWWMLSARHWFTGPKVQGTAEGLAAIEAELDSLA